MVRASISETTCSILRWITFTRWLAAATRRVLSRTEAHEDAIATVVSRDAECILDAIARTRNLSSLKKSNNRAAPGERSRRGRSSSMSTQHVARSINHNPLVARHT
jgi:hypothetical protein